MNNQQIQKQLLAEPNLKYQKAVELTLAMESASKSVGDLHMTKTNANSVVSAERVDSTCRFNDAKCYNCQKKDILQRNVKIGR